MAKVMCWCHYALHNTKKPRIGNCLSSVYVHHSAKLLGFAVGYMLAHGGVIAPQFEPTRVVFAVFDGGVRVGALGTSHFDNNAVAFFAGHCVPHKIICNC